MFSNTFAIRFIVVTLGLLGSFLAMVLFKKDEIARLASSLNLTLLRIALSAVVVVVFLMLPFVYSEKIAKHLPFSEYWQDISLLVCAAIYGVVLFLLSKMARHRQTQH